MKYVSMPLSLNYHIHSTKNSRWYGQMKIHWRKIRYCDQIYVFTKDIVLGFLHKPYFHSRRWKNRPQKIIRVEFYEKETLSREQLKIETARYHFIRELFDLMKKESPEERRKNDNETRMTCADSLDRELSVSTEFIQTPRL